jgi:hypothetical protein
VPVVSARDLQFVGTDADLCCLSASDRRPSDYEAARSEACRESYATTCRRYSVEIRQKETCLGNAVSLHNAPQCFVPWRGPPPSRRPFINRRVEARRNGAHFKACWMTLFGAADHVSHKKGGKPGCNSLPPLSTVRSETGESKANGLSDSISPA